MNQQREQFVVQTKKGTYFDETKPDVILSKMFMFFMIEGRRRNGGKFLKIKHIKARKMSSTDFRGLVFFFLTFQVPHLPVLLSSTSQTWSPADRPSHHQEDLFWGCLCWPSWNTRLLVRPETGPPPGRSWQACLSWVEALWPERRNSTCLAGSSDQSQILMLPRQLPEKQTLRFSTELPCENGTLDYSIGSVKFP